jgi:XRN 5'-3' exonuclease N-terminus
MLTCPEKASTKLWISYASKEVPTQTPFYSPELQHLLIFTAQPEHDPNTQHVLCGADADLIMLGLATHEPNFTIIREEFKPNQPRPCDICGQVGQCYILFKFLALY